MHKCDHGKQISRRLRGPKESRRQYQKRAKERELRMMLWMKMERCIYEEWMMIDDDGDEDENNDDSGGNNCSTVLMNNKKEVLDINRFVN